MDFLQKKLQERADQNAFRKLQNFTGRIDLCSNDYLGIATNGLIQIDPGYNHGSKGSRLLAGNYPLIEEVENLLAKFHEAEAALIFNSGYDANTGLLSCIASKEDTIIYDQLSHASIRDGIRLSRAQSFSFIHNDIADLEKKITGRKGNIFVVTESVFSMDGDRAPLDKIADLCETHKAMLIVDEAHATGVIGDKGEGLAQHRQLHKKCFAKIHTFGKGCGVHGAAVLGSSVLKNYLINFSRTFIYTTALPESAAAAIKKSYELFPGMKKEREQLKILCAIIQSSGLNVKRSDTPIQALIVPGNEEVKKIAAMLQRDNFDIRPILYPTVPKGSERLRIVLHAFNTEAQIQNLIKAFNY